MPIGVGEAGGVLEVDTAVALSRSASQGGVDQLRSGRVVEPSVAVVAGLGSDSDGGASTGAADAARGCAAGAVAGPVSVDHDGRAEGSSHSPQKRHLTARS